jgi:hypothetical protein
VSDRAETYHSTERKTLEFSNTHKHTQLVFDKKKSKKSQWGNNGLVNKYHWEKFNLHKENRKGSLASHHTQPSLIINSSQAWWLLPVILATWDDEIRKIMVPGQP